MRVGIIGAGLMGMALARKYAADGHTVTVIEHANQPGGLATWSDFGGFDWDRFYHVILPSDQQTIGFLNELGISDELEWNRTYTGFYVDQKLHSISSNAEFLKFPLLSFTSKIRLGFTMLYASRINSWKRLEAITCEQWLRKISGNENVDKLWKPLLLAKLGPSYSRVSAVFIWSYIKRMFSARDKSASAEHLGHVRGGYKSIFNKIEADIKNAGGTIRLNESVMRVSSSDEGVLVHTPKETHVFDHVVCTSPTNVLENIVDRHLLAVGKSAGSVEYLGVVCLVVVTKKPITDFYVVNIADETIPFTGVIGMSSVIDTKNTGGYYLTYLPRYMLSTDTELEKSDGYFRETFLQGLTKMFPDFDASEIVSVHVNRAIKVQPLQVLNYSSMVPSVSTNDDRLHVLNTSQFVNATLNNNEVIGAVNRFYENVGSSFVELASVTSTSNDVTNGIDKVPDKVANG